jgi:hypothetical protein
MKKKLLAGLSLIGLIVVAGLIIRTPPVLAAGYFNESDLIDDPVFNNYSSMTAAQIDSFINSFPNSCLSDQGSITFRSVDPTGYSPTTGFTYGGFVTAGQVIYDAAQAYQVNPEVLLATLQKEQSLVTGSSGCSTLQYTGAMGYGCPDGGTTYSYSGSDLYATNGNVVTSVSGTCVNSTSKAGFSQQVIHAAWLLKFGEERSEGNVGWAIINSSWNNSDDPLSCYSGPMTAGTWQICPGGPAVFYDGYISIDGQSFLLHNGATAALYWYTPHFSGNQNFDNIFSGWFGDPTFPYAFKTAESGTVYMFIDGFKIVVPYMGMLQDYSINPNAIETISDSTFNAIPFADSSTGYSTVLSSLVRSPDNATVYLVTVGKKYAINTYAQFTSYGFNNDPVAYVPDDYILSIPGTQPLSNYIETPTYSVFQVSNAQKRIIFDYPTYMSLNPANNATYVSYYFASTIPSGAPISNAPILIKYNDSAGIYLFDNNNYYAVASYDVYTCWGFQSTLSTPLYTLAENDYLGSFIPTTTLSCVMSDGSGNTYLLGQSTKYSVPSAFGLTSTTTSTPDLTALLNNLPTNSSSLMQYIKSNNAAAVWYLSSGGKRLVPTYSDFQLLGLTASNVQTVDSSALSSINTLGVKLGTGQLVKTDQDSAVYAINGDSRVLYSTSNSFLSYGNSWSGIETYPETELDQEYPYNKQTVSNWLYNQAANDVYLVDVNGCYLMNSALLSDYGQTLSSLQSVQPYGSAIFPSLNLPSCQSGSIYVKEPGQAVVYEVNNGTKYPFSGWNSLVAQSGTNNPSINILSDSVLSTLPTGAPL